MQKYRNKSQNSQEKKESDIHLMITYISIVIPIVPSQLSPSSILSMAGLFPENKKYDGDLGHAPKRT